MARTWRTYHLKTTSTELVGGLVSSVDVGPYVVHESAVDGYQSFESAGTGYVYVVTTSFVSRERVLGRRLFLVDGANAARWTSGEIVDVFRSSDVTVLKVASGDFGATPVRGTNTSFVVGLQSGMNHGRVACWAFPEAGAVERTVAVPPKGGDLQMSWLANVVVAKKRTTLSDFGFSVVSPIVSDSSKDHQRDAFFFVVEAPAALSVVESASADGAGTSTWAPWDFDPADLFVPVEAPDGTERQPKLVWGARVRVAEKRRRRGGRVTDDGSEIGLPTHYEGSFAGASSVSENMHFNELETYGLGDGLVDDDRSLDTGEPVAVDLRSPHVGATFGPRAGCSTPKTIAEGTVLLVGVAGFFEEAIRFGGTHANPELVFDAGTTEERASLGVSVVPFTPQPSGTSFERRGGVSKQVSYSAYSRRVVDTDDYWTKSTDDGGSPFDASLVQASWWRQPEAVFAFAGSVGGRVGQMVWSESAVPFPLAPWRDGEPWETPAKGSRSGPDGDGDWSRQWPRVQKGESTEWTLSAEGEDVVPSGTEIRDLSEEETAFLVDRLFLAACQPLDRDSTTRLASRSRGCWVSDVRWALGDDVLSVEGTKRRSTDGGSVDAVEPTSETVFYNATPGSLSIAAGTDRVFDVPYRGFFEAVPTTWLRRAEAAGALSSKRLDRALVSIPRACCDCAHARWSDDVDPEPAVTVSWRWGSRVGSAAQVTLELRDDRALSVGSSVSVSGPSAVPEDGVAWIDATGEGLEDLATGSVAVSVVGSEESSWGVARVDIELEDDGSAAWLGGNPAKELSGATLKYTAVDGSIYEIELPRSPTEAVAAAASGEFPVYGDTLPLWRVDPGWSVLSCDSFETGKQKGAWGIRQYSAGVTPVIASSPAPTAHPDRTLLVPSRNVVLRAKDSSGTLDYAHDVDYRDGVGATVSAVDSSGADSGSPAFSVSGSYTKRYPVAYAVEIVSEGTPDTYRLSSDGGITWGDETDVVAGSTALGDGLSIYFAESTGYTVGDTWTFAARSNARDFDASGEGYLRIERSGAFREAWISGPIPVAFPDGGDATSYVFRFRGRATTDSTQFQVSFLFSTGDVVQSAAETFDPLGASLWQTESASIASSSFPVGAETVKICLEVWYTGDARSRVELDSFDFYRGSSASYSPLVTGGCPRRTASALDGSPAFFADGHVSSVTADAALDDLTVGRDYVADDAGTRSYRVKIDSAGTPDTFRWSDTDGEAWEATGVSLAASHSLSHGVTIAWGATTGHSVGDEWTFSARPGVRAKASFFFAAPATFSTTDLDTAVAVSVSRPWLGTPGKTGTTLPSSEGGNPSRAAQRRVTLLTKRSS